MFTQIAAIAVLAVMFVIASVLPINMGALAFVGAFVIGLVANIPAGEIFAGFPADLFVTLVGITYLFAIAQNNGTIDWLVNKAVWLVRGRIAAVPWMMFIIAGVLTSVGAVSPGAVAIIAPIALRFAHKYRISPLLMGILVIHGAQAGGFSPISIYGGITNQVVERAGLPRNNLAMFTASLAFNSGIAVVAWLFFSRRRRTGLIDQGADAVSENEPRPVVVSQREHGEMPTAAAEIPAVEGASHESPPRLNLHRTLTLIGLVALGVGSLAFNLNVGLVAISVAVLLTLLAPRAQKGAVDQVSWSTVLLITGVVTYVAVLQKVGSVDLVGNRVSGMGAPLLGALLLCYIGGGVSAFASSVAVLGATIPLAVPFLLQGHIQPVGVVAAIAVSSTIVDVSPFSTNGALVVANVQGIDRDRFYRQLLIYSAIVVAFGPFLAWVVFILPGW
jgi:di/tricarboxylate transporter